MSATVFFLIIALLVGLCLILLLRSRKIKEKYAAFWLFIGAVILVLALFPQLLESMASLVGVEVGANLLFALAIILLLGVCLQLSLEVSRAEEQTRTLAEQVAILNLEMREAGLAPEGVTEWDPDSGNDNKNH